MAFVIATCSHWLLGGYDFSADLTSLAINYASEGQDATTMGMSTRKIVGGLKTSSLDAQGYINLGSSQNEPILFANVGVDDVLATVFPDGIEVGSTVETGYAMGTVQGDLSLGANVGALLPFSAKFLNGSLLVKATPLENWLSTAISTGAVNTGVAYNLGFAATCEAVYAGMHVTALSTALAGTVSAVIEAASSSGAGWTTRVTFAAQTNKAGVLATPIAPNALTTDQPWWRAVITQSTGTSTGSVSNGLIWMAIADRR